MFIRLESRKATNLTTLLTFCFRQANGKRISWRKVAATNRAAVVWEDKPTHTHPSVCDIWLKKQNKTLAINIQYVTKVSTPLTNLQIWNYIFSWDNTVLLPLLCKLYTDYCTLYPSVISLVLSYGNM